MKILKEAYTIPDNVVMFYDRHLRLWTLYIKDEEGNQISNTEYAPSRTDAIEMAQDIDNFVIRESLNEQILTEKSFYKEVADAIEKVTNGRGETALRQFICYILGLDHNLYDLHHINGSHDDNRPENLALIPRNFSHNTLHNIITSAINKDEALKELYKEYQSHHSEELKQELVDAFESHFYIMIQEQLIPGVIYVNKELI